jgi:DnaJ-class molecular chaperone
MLNLAVLLIFLSVNINVAWPYLVMKMRTVDTGNFELKISKNPSTNTVCNVCFGKEVVDCVPCKGTGIDKINGNVFERWTCNKCKGFGLIPCKCSVVRGLTPEQRYNQVFRFEQFF